MEAKLIVIGGKANKSEVKLKLPTIIGRSRSADLTVQHPKVSRQHCQIFERDGALMVRDNGSLNGTYVENNRISEAVLRPGDKLTVGPLTFVAVYEHTGSFPQMPVLAPKPKSAVDSELDTPDFKATAPDDEPVAQSPAVGATVADAEPDWFNDEPESDELLGTMERSPPLNSKPAAKLPASPQPAPNLDETHDFNLAAASPLAPNVAATPPIEESRAEPSAAPPAKSKSKLPEMVHPSDPTLFSVGEDKTLASPLSKTSAKSPKPVSPAAADDLGWLDDESDQNLDFSTSPADADSSNQTMQSSAEKISAEQLSNMAENEPAGDDFSWLIGADAKSEEADLASFDSEEPAAISAESITAIRPTLEPTQSSAAIESDHAEGDEGFTFKPLETGGGSTASTLPEANEAAKKKAWWPFGSKKKGAQADKPETQAAVAAAAKVEEPEAEAAPVAPDDLDLASEAPTTKVDTEQSAVPSPPEASDDEDLNNFFKSLG